MGTHAVTLREWIAAHGPLSAPAAFVMALDVCAQLGRCAPRRIGETMASIDSMHVLRTDGGWAWRAVEENGPAAADSAAIERLGALLFESLTGERPRYPLPGEQRLREQLRASRPDLAADVVDIVVAAAARPRATSLSQFALELRRAIANERPATGSGKRPAVLLAVCALTVLSISWTAMRWRDNHLDVNGLTPSETVALDVLTETAQAYALGEEHTAAAGLYDGIAGIWRRRLAPDDPRDAWNEMHLAWVKSLANDRVTAEQLLAAKPQWLAAALGARHPYARAARLELAHAVFARGTVESAAALRDQSERDTALLLSGAIDPADLLEGVPVPPGTIAHAAPAAPVSEGFRPRSDGTFAIPLTSLQRWIAGRDGWRFHVIAKDACSAGLAIGDPPRLVGLTTMRESSGWQIRTEGLAPRQLIHVGATSAVGISLLDAPGTGVRVRVQAGAPIETGIDESAAAPVPPYTLTFDGAGCALVWLEIPFPYGPKS